MLDNPEDKPLEIRTEEEPEAKPRDPDNIVRAYIFAPKSGFFTWEINLIKSWRYTMQLPYCPTDQS